MVVWKQWKRVMVSQFYDVWGGDMVAPPPSYMTQGSNKGRGYSGV